MSFFKKLLGIAEDNQDPPKNQAPTLIETEYNGKEKLKKNIVDSPTSLLNIKGEQIFLHQSFTSKSEVLVFIAQNMHEQGFVSGDYFDALNKREELVSTYLINGIAIPHGINEAKSLVTKTGVIIVQIPTGIIWNESGDIAKLVVGIAAKGNEHLSLLQKLSSVVMDPILSESLVTTTDINIIIQTLRARGTVPKNLQEGFTITAEATVVDQYGLHAEPANILAEHAALYKNTQIHLHSGGRCANIKSMSVILMMGIKEGDNIIISAKGEHAQAAVDDLAKLINAGLGS